MWIGVKFTLVTVRITLWLLKVFGTDRGQFVVFIDYRLSGVATHRITQLLAYAVGDGSDQKLGHILQSMYSESAAKLYLWIEDDGEAVGLIGWRVQGGLLQIIHIAVDEGKRHQGIGRRLIDAAIALERPHEVLAETDHDAVEFYQHYGCSIQSLGEKYPGVERFQCRWQSGT